MTHSESAQRHRTRIQGRSRSDHPANGQVRSPLSTESVVPKAGEAWSDSPPLLGVRTFLDHPGGPETTREMNEI